MRWGSEEFRFIRPLHWILAICGTKTLNFEIAGIKSSNKTFGHRFLGSGSIAVNASKGITFKAFNNSLSKGKVMADQNERKAKISEMVKSASKKLGGSGYVDKDILDEVVHLVEWPAVITGGFKKGVLKPSERGPYRRDEEAPEIFPCSRCRGPFSPGVHKYLERREGRGHEERERGE